MRTESIDLDVSLNGYAVDAVIDHQVMTHANLEAVNTAKAPNNVVPKKGKGARIADGRLRAKLAALFVPDDPPR